MNKIKLFNVGMVFLCVVAIWINHFSEDRKAIGIACIVLIGVLAIFKEKFCIKK